MKSPDTPTFSAVDEGDWVEQSIPVDDTAAGIDEYPYTRRDDDQDESGGEYPHPP